MADTYDKDTKDLTVLHFMAEEEFDKLWNAYPLTEKFLTKSTAWGIFKSGYLACAIDFKGPVQEHLEDCRKYIVEEQTGVN